MELRWIKKETEKGKYVLQQKKEGTAIEWFDVPCLEEPAPQSFRDELAEKIYKRIDTYWSKYDIADLAIKEVVKKAEEVKKKHGMPELNHINTLIQELQKGLSC